MHKKCARNVPAAFALAGGAGGSFVSAVQVVSINVLINKSLMQRHLIAAYLSTEEEPLASAPLWKKRLYDFVRNNVNTRTLSRDLVLSDCNSEH